MRSVLLLLATIVAAASTAATASAATPVTVSIYGCAFVDHGAMTVPEGSTVTFRSGWATTNRGFTQMFLEAVTTTASIDGTPIADAAGYWSTPAKAGGPDFPWLTLWTYPTGVTLGAGDSVTLSTDWVLSHTVLDGSTTDGELNHIPAGSVFGGPVSCTVTGA
jgi:hypothetical protein